MAVIPERHEVAALRKKCECLENALAHTLSSEKHLRLQLRAVDKECVRKVASVRHFWKDCIYNEQKRSGIILKKSMQK